MEDYSSKTVKDLRTIAKENGIPLPAGVNKADIVTILEEKLSGGEQQAPGQVTMEDAVKETAATPAEEEKREAPAPAAEEPPRQQFKPAWHNPSNRYSSGYNAQRGYQRGAERPQQEWNSPARNEQTEPPARTFGPSRFGPTASAPQENYSQSWAERSTGRIAGTVQTDRAPSYRASGFRDQRQEFGGSFDGGRATPSYRESYTPAPEQPFQGRDLLSAADTVEGGGVLEMNGSEGYGYLRGATFLPTGRDIMVQAAQVRRFGLRSGDLVSGKVKPQKDGEKFATMLMVTSVNRSPADTLENRPFFDDLTAVYPTRKLRLESRAERLTGLRAMDLLAPIGFGQRALLLCQPETHHRAFLRDMANVIAANHPEAEVLVLLAGETPEEVTRFRDNVNCHVVASTFDQTPETHLRLCDLVLEYAKRTAECRRDIVLLVDNLTRIAKTAPSSAAQQGRAALGMVNPTGLARAKRLFGAARALREGGSITVIGVMPTDQNKVDDTLIEEFRPAANLVYQFETALARASLYPAVNLLQSSTHHMELMLGEEQVNGARQLRAALATTQPAAALQQVLAMANKLPTNDEVLARVPEWLQLMK